MKLLESLLFVSVPALTAVAALGAAAAPAPPQPAQAAALTRLTPFVGTVTQGSAGVFSPMNPQSPAAKRYMRWQHRWSLQKQYEDVGEALRLSRAETEKVIDLLVDQMTRNMTETRKGFTDMATAMKEAQARKERDNAELVKVIGQNRLPLWEDYQNSLAQRAQVLNMREQMQMMGVPLTDDQRAQLLSVFLEEKDRNPFPRPAEDVPPEERMAASMKWQEENEKNLLERMKPVLSAEQFARYSDYQAYQTEMRQMFSSLRPAMPLDSQSAEQNGGGNSLMFRSWSAPVPADRALTPTPAK